MKVSIIIPVRNRPDLARVCIDSVETYTTVPYEVILVQEGENEELNTLLKSYDALLVQNKVPKGFAGALNTGIACATGTHYCFLSHDTVVTPLWLEKIMEAFTEGVGLVAPTLPEAGIVQSIDHNKGQKIDLIEDATSLKGVCFVVSKEAMDKVGVWDESFGLGGGEDNDLCIRVQQAGFKLVIARESFIYHYGSASFRELFDNDIERSKVYARSQHQKLREKHNLPPDVQVRIAIPTVTGVLSHTLALRLLEWSHSGIPISIRFYPYLVPLDNARNRAVKDFLEDSCSHLLFIDDDITPPPNALVELLKANKDIIAPLCFTFGYDKDGLPFPQPVAHRKDEQGQYRPYIGKGIEETDVVTGGMFLVKRAVYEQLERPFSFTYHKNGLVIYSEDFVFSQQCQALGYTLYTHYGLLCGHRKEIDVKDINGLMVKYAK